MATATDVRGLLDATSLPPTLADRLVDGASATWLMGEQADVIAADLALCHPRLRAGEVRAAVRPTTDAVRWRLTVVTHDRPGVLAGAAGVLATHGLTIESASVNTWSELSIALVHMAVADPGGGSSASWDRMGQSLRQALGAGVAHHPAWDPVKPVQIQTTAESAGRTMIRLRAPDRVGLLWATSQWLADQGTNIEVARALTDDGSAETTFVVQGSVDAAALTRHLSGGEVEVASLAAGLSRLPAATLRTAARVTGRIATEAWSVTRRLARRSPTEPSD